jgi:hypothetical protein
LSSSPLHLSAGVIIGIVAAILAVIGVVVLLWHRWQIRKHKSSQYPFSRSRAKGGPSATVTPFIHHTRHQGSDPPMEQRQLPSELPASPIPIGLSSKGLARLRTEALGPQHTDSRATLDTSRFSSSPTLVAVTPTVISDQNRVVPPSDTQRLRSEVEFLRREMQRLQVRKERFEAPQSYIAEDV